MTGADVLAGIPDPNDFKQGAGDDKLLVIFYKDVLHDEGKSVDAGRPIYVDTDFMRVHIPGDPTSVVVRPVSEVDKRRFALQWARYLQGMKEEDQLSGTPLKEWPSVTRAQVEELRFFQIRTVEHLAEVGDAVKMKMPGLTRLSQLARIWLDKANHTAEAAKHQQKIDEQDNKIEVLERTVKTLIHEKEILATKAGVAA